MKLVVDLLIPIAVCIGICIDHASVIRLSMCNLYIYINIDVHPQLMMTVGILDSF